jgi:hypothetical protein
VTPVAEPAPRLDVVLGRADDARAEVYVCLVGGPAGATITGTLTGPRCRLATTLPTTPPLRPLAGEGRAAARAIVTEPSFWTPELPNLYELVAEARTTAGVCATTRRLVGLRRLGVRGRSIWLDGRRWVPRGRAVSNEAFDPAWFRAEQLTAMIPDPTLEACAAADAIGVPIVAHLSDEADTQALLDRVAALAQHPAAVMAVVPRQHVAAIGASRSTGTMLVAVEADASEPTPATLEPGVQCLVARIAPGATPLDAWRDHAPGVPIVAWREGAGEGRRACDALQADLAAWACAGGRTPTWDWAGYIVP